MSAVKIYNETYHSGLRCTPKEAIRDSNKKTEMKWELSEEGDYLKNFVKRTGEKFMVGKSIRLSKRENLGNYAKKEGIVLREKGFL